MSLKEAVLDIADILQEEAEARAGGGEPVVVRLLLQSARMLRNAVKAAGDAPNPSILPFAASPLSQHQQMIDQARMEFRQHQQKEESSEPRMLLVVGGPDDGTYIGMDPSMPVGARTNINGQVYKLGEDGQLHCEEQKGQP